MEKLETNNRYDLIVFSESFQYVKLQDGIAQCKNLLNENGYLLICDFFQLARNEPSPLRGGKKLNNFFRAIDQFPFRLVTDIDITKETSPTIDILDHFLSQFLKPTAIISSKYLSSNFPIMSGLIKWKLRKRLEKINNVYLSNNITSRSFMKHKSYRLFLFVKHSN